VKTQSLRPLALALALLLVSAALGAQAVPVDVEVGYRWVDVTGNEQMYRTQVNDRQGFLVRSLLYDSRGPLGGLDFFRIDASDVGAGPAGMLRLSGGRTDMFRLDFSWRHQDLYSALPAFANPFVDAGVIPGQHTYNRGRDIYEANLQLMPGYIVSPILGYTRNVYHGPGRTTYTVGQDDFALDENVRATDQEYRIGLAFHAGPVEGAVTQGWRRFRENDTETLLPGAGGGNNPGTLLDRPVTATGIQRSTSTSVNTPVTSAWITGRFLDRVKLTGSYVHASPDVTGSSLETDAGSFVSFQILRFFAGLVDTITPKVDTKAWRGQARAEIEILPGLDLIGGWMEKRSSQTGLDLISSLFQNTATFAGQSTGDILRVLQTSNSIDRTERLFDASVSARIWAPLAVNAGWSQTHQNVTVTPDAAEIVISGGQGGNYQRTVNTYGGGAKFTVPGWTLTVDYRRDDANQPIFRTDFITRNRLRTRAFYDWGDVFRIGGTWQETTATNDQVEIGYRTKVREVAGDIEITLVPTILKVRGSAGNFRADRQILERAPQTFLTAIAKNAEFGHTWEGGATITVSRLSIDGGYILLTNSGNLPYTLKRAHIRGDVGLTKNLSLGLEWRKDLYKESDGPGLAGSLSNYDANRYYLGLHWKP
jgi:hypothetical protein